MTEKTTMLIGEKLARLASEQPIESIDFVSWKQAVETIDTDALRKVMERDPDQLDVIFGDNEEAVRQFVQKHLLRK